MEKIVRDNSAVMGDAMRRLHEDLADLQTWLDYVFEHVRAHMDDAAKLDVIRRLREDTAGRTEAEIATANRLADHLERKIHARLMRRSELALTVKDPQLCRRQHLDGRSALPEFHQHPVASSQCVLHERGGGD